MTTTTVFADTSDFALSCTDATYATARSGSGTFSSSSTAFTADIGQALITTTYYCLEFFCYFDTSGIADTDVVSSATLSLFGSADNSETDFVLEARAKDWNQAAPSNADFVAGASLGALTLLATLSSASYAAAYMDLYSQLALLDYVSKTAGTEVIFCSDRMGAGTTPTQREYLSVATANTGGTTNDPKLVVVSAPPITNAPETLRVVTTTMRW